MGANVQNITNAQQLPDSVDSPAGEPQTGIGEKLQQRLSRYANQVPHQEPVSGSTITAVYELVSWLTEQSNTVSATVAEDGILSVAVVFPDDVRLYVEIERDGSTGAVVSRSRTQASDLPLTTIHELTPELVLAAVGSV